MSTEGDPADIWTMMRRGRSSNEPGPRDALGKALAQDGGLRGTFEIFEADEETKAIASPDWLLDLTSDRSASVRAQAIMSICEKVENGEIPADALEALIPLLGDRSSTVRRSASYTVAILADRDQIDPRALSPLEVLLGDKDRTVRSNAACALRAYAERGCADGEGFEMLANLLSDRYAHVRRDAVRAISGYALLGHGSEHVLEALLGLMGDRHPSVRLGATTAVCNYARMDRIEPEGLATLVRGSRDRYEDVRVQAVLGIVLYSLAGSFSDEAIDVLLRHLRSQGMVMIDESCYKIRRLAALPISEYASADLGYDKVLPWIAGCLEDPDEYIRNLLAQAFLNYAKAGRLAASLPRGIIDMLDDLEFENQVNAAEIIVEHARKGYCDPKAIEPLLKLLEGDDIELCLIAGKALAYCGMERWVDEKVIKVAMDFLGDEIAAVREMGAFLTGCYAMGGMCKRHLLDLLDLRIEDPDERVRGFVFGAVLLYAEKGYFALPALRSLVMNLGP